MALDFVGAMGASVPLEVFAVRVSEQNVLLQTRFSFGFVVALCALKQSGVLFMPTDHVFLQVALHFGTVGTLGALVPLDTLHRSVFIQNVVTQTAFAFSTKRTLLAVYPTNILRRRMLRQNVALDV